MKYFLDTEFIESGPHKPIDLISIGLVAEDGREYYAISSEFRDIDASDWVKDNVLNNLEIDIARKSLELIKTEITHFTNVDNTPEFWGYYADYDWVVFCQIFGSMMNLPRTYPMFCRDLKQWCKDLGNPKLQKQLLSEHNALNDAKWNKEIWHYLNLFKLNF